MTTMVTEVYDALRDIGVSEEKAKHAAEAMAVYDPQLSLIRSDLRLMKWELGAIFAFLVTVSLPTLLLVFRVASKVGALAF